MGLVDVTYILMCKIKLSAENSVVAQYSTELCPALLLKLIPPSI